MKILTRLLLVLAVLLGISAVLPLLFPYSLVADRFERQLSQITRGKVSIAEIGFAYTPMPAFQLRRMTIDNAETATVASVEIPLSLSMLLAEQYSLTGVRLEGAKVSRQFAQNLPQRLQGDSRGALLENLQFSNSTITLEKGSLGPLSGEIRFYKDGRIAEIEMSANSEGQAHLRAVPGQQGEFMLEFQASNWTLPLRHPLKFDSVRLAGKANTAGLSIDAIQATLYGGALSGNAQLFWDNNWALSGQLQAKQLNADSLLQVFSPVTRVSGRLQGELQFQLQAPTYQTLLDNAAAQGSFLIKDGNVHNMDLVAPLKAQAASVALHGGQTPFNTLTGRLGINGETVTLSGLDLESGKFRARGNVQIRQERLAGSILTQLISGPVALSGGVTLGGDLTTPELRSAGSSRPTPTSEGEPEAAPE
ncbi:AsmA family protein [Chitinilyticum litopenaei]|uniref:AsmA family protein n=1 Tax=Chitinilyticum litopenaei TaxID=1121276 RepID=UPI00042A6E37|nr:AsmA family protein [Chitinilyticum litopenaei]